MKQLSKEQRQQQKRQDMEEVSQMKSMMPPTFQLQASEGAPIQMARTKDKGSGGGDDQDPYKGMFNPHKVSPVNLKRRKKKENSNRIKYISGTHGAKGREQKRLKEVLGKTVSGKTHQSEHVVGFEVINRSNEEKRGKGKRAKELENNAPAYQEGYQFHRDHIGTGNSKKIDGSGFNSQSYRDTQRTLLENEQLGTAMQINQLGYSFVDNFKFSDTTSMHQSNESFSNMVMNVNDLSFANDQEDEDGDIIQEEREVSMNQNDQKEVLASRAVALLGRYLTGSEIGVLSAYVMPGAMDFDIFVKKCWDGEFNYEKPKDYK